MPLYYSVFSYSNEQPLFAIRLADAVVVPFSSLQHPKAPYAAEQPHIARTPPGKQTPPPEDTCWWRHTYDRWIFLVWFWWKTLLKKILFLLLVTISCACIYKYFCFLIRVVWRGEPWEMSTFIKSNYDNYLSAQTVCRFILIFISLGTVGLAKQSNLRRQLMICEIVIVQ